MVKAPDIWQLLETVHDPEVPALTVVDLGVVRDVSVGDDGGVAVTITPTYSGCPAMNTIEMDIRACLAGAGYPHATVRTVLSPAWTTDWLSEKGKQKLLEYGIAPPVEPVADPRRLFGAEPVVQCPRCRSSHTEMLSLFGSTACKAQYRCLDCREPFDYFKCLR
jgi:ring-1,2-phenylacetyl-CoA epoxidase subunit PaaD